MTGQRGKMKNKWNKTNTCSVPYYVNNQKGKITMKRIQLLTLAVLMIVGCLMLALAGNKEIQLETTTGSLFGTLEVADTNTAKNTNIVALIIAGSGPTDRDGNNQMMVNNSLKMIAESLADDGIASIRYDKRGVGASVAAGVDETKLRFEHYIEDANAWVNFIEQEYQPSKIVVIGHSEGALIGSVVAQQNNVDQFISIAGAGRPTNELILEQIAAQAPHLIETVEPMMNTILKGGTVEDVPPYLNSLFRPSVQPYMISWLAYKPAIEIAKVTKPVLLVQGTTDIQVKVKDAKVLSAANSNAQLTVIEGMNHVLKDAPADRHANMMTYTQPDLPLNAELMDTLVRFITTS
jgi:alpha-beta hydrolase superfamily lysophospholipase